MILALGTVQWALAVPAFRGLHQHVQPDGTVVSYYLQGDEHFHAFSSPDGYALEMTADGALRYAGKDAAGKAVATVLAHNAAARTTSELRYLKGLTKLDFAKQYRENAPRMIKAHRSVEGGSFTKGDIKGLVLLVEFADNSFNEAYTRDVFDEQMNGEHFTKYDATGSVAQYFKDQSMNQFRPSFDVVGPVKLKNDIAYYGENVSVGFSSVDKRPQEMVIDACKAADTLYNVDFSKYDNDGDGAVDFVYVIYAGYGESYGASPNTIWPHQDYINNYGYNLSLDGVAINRYACSCELKNTSGATLEGIGTFCHEFGHVLGLADIYNTSASSTQLGVWSIMDEGCYNNNSRTPPSYSAFERSSVGWLKYTELDTPGSNIALPELTQNNVAYRISTQKANEYFLLESRQQVGWDAYLPAAGMMITHIDYDASAWANNSVNADDTHPRYCMVAADGTRTTTPEGNLYPGSANNTSFSDESTPNSLSWDGTPTGKSVAAIRNDGGAVTFSFMQKKLLLPVIADATDVTSSSFTARWHQVANARSYTLTVVDQLSDTLRPVPFDEDFSLMKAGNYPNADATDISATLDNYMADKGWTGTSICQAGGSCRIGQYGVSGRLTTPETNLYTGDGTYTVAFNARPFTGKSLNYTLSVNDLTSGTQVQKVSLKAKGAGQNVVLTFAGGPRRANLSLESNHERLFIDNFKLIRGTVDSALVAEKSNPRHVFEGIADTCYTVSGLTAGRSYLYYVQAMAGDVLFNSDLSATATVTLPATTVGVTAPLSATSDAKVQVYDLSGRLVYEGTGEGLSHAKLSGLYLVRKGGEVRKVVLGK
jgi:immune inhibitor A